MGWTIKILVRSIKYVNHIQSLSPLYVLYHDIETELSAKFLGVMTGNKAIFVEQI